MNVNFKNHFLQRIHRYIRFLFLRMIIIMPFELFSQQTAEQPWNPRMQAIAPSVPSATPSAPLRVETADSVDTPKKEKATITLALKGIVLIDSPKNLVRHGIAGVNGLESRGVSPPNRDGLEAVLAPYWGKPLTLSGGMEIAQIVAKHYRENDNPLVYVVIPSLQKILDDTLQIVVIEGVIGTITAEGNEFTELAQLTGQMRQKSGEPIRLSFLEHDMVWLNTPKRQVDMVVGKGTKPRTADVLIKVAEQSPWDVFTGYNDSGSRLTGKSRFYAGTSHANLWKRDHQVAYQFSQGEHYHDFFSHFFTYTTPIHSTQQTIRTFVSYSESLTRFTAGGLASSTQGKNTQVGMRYSIPLTMKQIEKRNFSFGADYKQSNSGYDFAFFGTPLTVSPTATETIQLVVGYDQYELYGGEKSQFPGSFTLGVNVFGSPGGLSSDNSTTAYQASNRFADPFYAYGKIDISRVFVVKKEWLINLRGSAQYSPMTLLGGEQFGITGDNFVRGYDPSEGTGDFGYIASVSRDLYAIRQYFRTVISDRIFGRSFSAYRVHRFWIYRFAKSKRCRCEHSSVGCRSGLALEFEKTHEFKS